MGAVVIACGLLPAVAAAEEVPFLSASESYYQLDVPAGTMSVRVEIEFQNASAKDLPTLQLFVLPGAANVAVKSGDETLTSAVTFAGTEEAGMAGHVVATLPKPLRPNLKTKLTMTYDMAPTRGAFINLEPGVIETVFIGQGPGSFVIVDVPQNGDNYFDPGCLKAGDQPSAVKGIGAERWVCGEVLTIAVNSDNPAVLERCANMDNACRQRGSIAAFSAYVQSITDESQRGLLEADVQMKDSTVKLALKYFKRDTTWAQKQFEVAQKSFPLLEQAFGFPYPGKTVTLRQSHHLAAAGLAGIAFPTEGQVLVSSGTGLDDEVTVHELAHQWAGHQLETSWLWEGLAEYATRTVAEAVGVTPVASDWKASGYKDPLSSWYNGSAVRDPDYWYGKSGDFWFAYEAAIGGRDNMRVVLGLIDDEEARWPLDGRWFMDRGESQSGANLDALFTEWVFNPTTSAGILAERRAAHDLVRELRLRAEGLGVAFGPQDVPSDIFDNLEVWSFESIAGTVARGHKVLDSYTTVAAKSEETGLGQSSAIAKSWGKKMLTETAGLVEQQRQAIDAIMDSAEQLKAEPAESLALVKVAEARAKYTAGDFAEAKKLAADALTTAFNEVASIRMIEIAQAKQESFTPSFLGKVGMLWSDPRGDLAKAEAAYEAGDSAAALKLSRSAYDSWNTADMRGIQRLAMLAALMCALTFGVWFLLRKLDGPAAPLKKPGQGHFLESSEERVKHWKDWENIP